MPDRTQTRAYLITGATGIASATAVMAAREANASVFIMSRGEEECRDLVKKVNAVSGRKDCAAYCTADLTRPEEVTYGINKCLSHFGRIDALFNVAGISGRTFGDGPLHECTEEGWDITLTTNVKSMFLVCREVLRHMMGVEPRGGGDGLRGTILNMASVLATSPEPRFFSAHAYAASKGAIVSLSRSMASYYAAHKIRVNAIAPSLVRTPMSRRAQSDESILNLMRTKQPLAEDLIDAEEIARAALFLLGSDSRMITGEVLTVDAGWSVSG